MMLTTVQAPADFDCDRSLSLRFEGSLHCNNAQEAINVAAAIAKIPGWSGSVTIRGQLVTIRSDTRGYVSVQQVLHMLTAVSQSRRSEGYDDAA